MSLTKTERREKLISLSKNKETPLNNLNDELKKINENITKQRIVKNNLLKEIGLKTQEYDDLNKRCNDLKTINHRLESEIKEKEELDLNKETLMKDIEEMEIKIKKQNDILEHINNDIKTDLSEKYEKIKEEEKEKYDTSLRLIKEEYENKKKKILDDFIKKQKEYNDNKVELDKKLNDEKKKIVEKIKNQEETLIREKKLLLKSNKNTKAIQSDNIILKEHYDLEITKYKHIKFNPDKKIFKTSNVQTEETKDDFNFENRMNQRSLIRSGVSSMSIDKNVLWMNKILSKKTISSLNVEKNETIVFKKDNKISVDDNEIKKLLFNLQLNKNLNIFLHDEKKIKKYSLNIHIKRNANGKHLYNKIILKEYKNDKTNILYNDSRSKINLNDKYTLILDFVNGKIIINCEKNDEIHQYNFGKGVFNRDKISWIYTEDNDARMSII